MNNKNTNNKTQEITLASMFIALIALLGFVPMVGFINIPPVAITIIHIPVILGAISMRKYKYAFIFGLSFGLISFIVNSYTPGVMQPLFFNPMVSIVPRLFVGLTTLFAYNLTLKLSKNNIVSMIIGAIIGTMTNTILVITAMGIFGQGSFAQGFLGAIKYIITVNGSLEILASVILVPIIGTAISKYTNKV
jgi:uncharacterized membrane protein